MIIDTPLASARDLASLMGIGTPGIYTSLGELSEARLVDSDSLGWSRPRTARWFLTEKGLARLGRTGSSWHEEAHRCGLLQRCPSVEWFYQVAGSMDDLGSFESFQWFDNLSFDAVARYERGWVALFWSGTLQPVDLIAGRLRQFGPDLLDMAVTLEVPWPGQLVFVVSDQWQGELVMQAARQYYLEDQVSVWCAADGSRSGARECGPSRGRVHQVVYPRGLGGWPWEKRLTRSPWAERGGLAVGRILDTVVQWPGMTTALGAQVLNEGITGRSAQKSLTRLLGHGLLHRQLGQGRYRYAATSGGVDCLARRDRVHFSQCKSHIDDLSWVDQPRVRAHRDQILSFISHFLAADMGVAAGWRAWERPDGRDGIKPDGVVHLNRTPYGRSWYHFVYKRTAWGEQRVRRLLEGYVSPRRRHRLPLLVVCRHDAEERVFHQVGEELDVAMLTTTIRRLEDHGPLDTFLCWSQYGPAVRIS